MSIQADRRRAGPRATSATSNPCSPSSTSGCRARSTAWRCAAAVRSGPDPDLPVIMLTARTGEIDRVLRPRARRRRLRHEAVLAPRARRPGVQRDPAARRGPRHGRCDGAHAGDVDVDLGRREARVDGAVDRARHARVRPAAVPGREPGLALTASSCSTTCGATAGTATSARSTCTSASCARSSATAAARDRLGRRLPARLIVLR